MEGRPSTEAENKTNAGTPRRFLPFVAPPSGEPPGKKKSTLTLILPVFAAGAGDREVGSV